MKCVFVCVCVCARASVRVCACVKWLAGVSGARGQGWRGALRPGAGARDVLL